MENDYRVHITVRRRAEAISDSIEIKTEHYDDFEGIHLAALEFIEEAILSLEEGSDDDDAA